MKEFLISHASELIILCMSMLNIIVSILCKKSKVIDSVFEQAVSKLPDLICKAETLSLTGAEKKTFVISAILSFICQLTGKSSDEIQKTYFSRISEQIEAILSTPKKKEVIIHEENKDVD